MVADPIEMSLNMDAVPMPWMQCHGRWMQYVVTVDLLPMKEDAVSLL